MASFFSNEFVNGVLEEALRGNAYSFPGATYVALVTATPTRAWTMTNVDANEVGYTGYSRPQVTQAQWTALTGGQSIANVELDFGQKTDTGSESVDWMCLVSSASGSGGTFYGAVELAGTLTITQFINPKVASGDFDVDGNSA